MIAQDEISLRIDSPIRIRTDPPFTITNVSSLILTEEQFNAIITKVKRNLDQLNQVNPSTFNQPTTL